MTWKQVRKVERRIRREVRELMRQAAADDSERPDGIDVPRELESRRKRLEALGAAKRELERRARQRYERDRERYDEKVEERRQKEQRDGRKIPGRKPKEPQPGPVEGDKVNLTDEQSRIMSASTGGQESENREIDCNEHAKPDNILPTCYAASDKTIGSGCQTPPISLICPVC